MKGISKKLLSILATVCLLASIALPAGLLTSAGTETDPTLPAADDVIYKFDFSGLTDGQLARTNSIMLGNNSDGSVTKVNIKFDYYLGGDAFYTVTDNVNTVYYDKTTGQQNLLPGKHTFEASKDVSLKNFFFGIFGNTKALSLARDHSAPLYIWNLEISGTDHTGNKVVNTSNIPWNRDYVTKVAHTDVPTEYNNGGMHKLVYAEANKTAKLCGDNMDVSKALADSYTLSFDYYLVDNVTAHVFDWSGSNAFITAGTLVDDTTGTNVLKVGEKATFTASAFTRAASQTQKKLPIGIQTNGPATLYVWNVTLRVNDANGAAIDNNFAAGCKWGSGVTATFMPYDDPSDGVGNEDDEPIDPTLPAADDVIYKFDFSGLTDGQLARTNSIMLGNNSDGSVTKVNIKFDYYLGGDAFYTVTDNVNTVYY
ncbi:MAG: hypothetical protein IJC15_04340, partial [Clostridia bacterium]|nr:hypothetical protein [Clostridia bacterium]